MRMRRMLAEGVGYYHVISSPDYQTLMTVGSYIDLNPVRAEIVKNPGDYRWSGYGTDVRGHALSRKGMSAFQSWPRPRVCLVCADFVNSLTPFKDTSRRCECCDDVDLYTARWLRGEDKVSVPKGRVG